MCTAVSYKPHHHYFGRNLDLERGYGEEIVITPRSFPLRFRKAEPQQRHFAMIGAAVVADNFPLYFEATNEKGLSMAGLNFPRNAHYYDYAKSKENVAPFELIPYLLGRCDSVTAARQRLENINVVNISFSEELPLSPLHWLIADKNDSIVLECTQAGMKIYNNPFGVLTNNPAFDFHLNNVSNYMGLHEGAAENRMAPAAPLANYSLGMGAIGLPGDFSSASRFVKAVFVKEKSLCAADEKSAVNQFFHILQSVAMPRGCVALPSGEHEYTRYSCCCTDEGVYYCTTYESMGLQRVDMNSSDLEGSELICCPMV